MIDLYVDNDDNLVVENQTIKFLEDTAAKAMALRLYLKRNKSVILQYKDNQKYLFNLIITKAIELDILPSVLSKEVVSAMNDILNIDVGVTSNVK